MLGLAQHVGGAHLGVDCLVGDHHGLGRAGEDIDPYLSVELPLGLSDEGVAGGRAADSGLPPEGRGFPCPRWPASSRRAAGEVTVPP